MHNVITNMCGYFYGILGVWAQFWGTRGVPNEVKLLFITNFSMVMPHIRCKLKTNIMYRYYTYIWRVCTETILYWGNQSNSRGQKGWRNGAKMLIINYFSTVMPYIHWKLNKKVTYLNHECIWTWYTEKYSLPW